MFIGYCVYSVIGLVFIGYCVQYRFIVFYFIVMSVFM